MIHYIIYFLYTVCLVYFDVLGTISKKYLMAIPAYGVFNMLILRGQAQINGVIFHLLTDPDEINTAYVKLKKKYFCS